MATFPVGSTAAIFSGDAATFPVVSVSATFSGAATFLGMRQCLSQDFDFFPKKELFNLFRELLAKERSYPFTVKIAR